VRILESNGNGITQWEYTPRGVYQFLRLVLFFVTFLFLAQCGTLSWLSVAFWAHCTACGWQLVTNIAATYKNWKLNQIVHKSGNKRTQKPSNLTSKRYCFLETFSVWAIVSYRLVWRCVYLHCEAAKRGQYYFACFSFNTWEKLVNFFMYIKERTSYNSVCLILAWVKNFS